MRPVPGRRPTSAITRTRSSPLWPGAATGPSARRRPARSARRGCAVAPPRGGRRSFRGWPAGARPASTASCAACARVERPTLWVKHPLLPHGPYLYLPSGAHTREGVRDLVPGMNGLPGFRDPFLTRHNEQRYLLQLGFVDRLIGRLLRRLKGQGMYDNTLIVVTADHGISWQPGVDTRRSRERLERRGGHARAADRQGARPAPGRVSDVLARTLDVTPTIAGLLGRAARATAPTALRLRPGGAPAADGEPRHARLQLGGTDLARGAGRRAGTGDQPQACASSAPAPRACTPASVPTATARPEHGGAAPRAAGAVRRHGGGGRASYGACGAAPGSCPPRSPAT